MLNLIIVICALNSFPLDSENKRRQTDYGKVRKLIISKWSTEQNRTEIH